MTKTTTNLLLMLITIVAGTYFYITCCSECSTTIEDDPPKEAIVEEAIPDATSNPFAFSDGDYSFSVNENYNFKKSSSEILMPLASRMEPGINGLKTHLEDNINKVVNITGYYKGDETNNTAYPNLGLARANAVKNHLTTKGISSSKINTKGELMESMVAKDNIYLGPVTFDIDAQAENAEDELQALYDKINDNPLVLYFNTAEASINLNSEQRQKIADISRYLDKVEGASANIVGHTDDTGNAQTNMRLGLDRANFAKNYLKNNGISEAKINTSSKGQTQPLESNATEEGRSKNRRTVVTLNQ